MSSSFGQLLKISIFVESHSFGVGMSIDGLPAGISIDMDQIYKALKNRHISDGFSTSRNEEDKVVFISGIFNNATTGAPLAFFIQNKDSRPEDYEKGVIRPSHADLTNYIKYNGNNDYRGGGFSSGRLTASLVVLGSICEQILGKYNIKILTHVLNIHGINDRNIDFSNIEKEAQLLDNPFPVLDAELKEKMIQEIKNAKENNDSVGGITESVIVGLPAGIGEPYFDSLESSISNLLFSIGGIKGVLFGDGIDFANKFGSEVNDQICINNGDIHYLSNHSGGINGGISNGQPINIKCVVKPVSSIGKTQKSINIETKENIDLSIKGRHDSCIVHRVAHVVNAVLYYAILDALMVNKGRNIWLKQG